MLRGLAAVMVLTGHVLAEAEHYFSVDLPGGDVPWARGVDIFFVISGFIIALSLVRFAGQPIAFLHRRILRVVPLYYLFTTLMVAVLILLPGAAKDTILDPGQIFSSYGFLPYERDDGRIAPVLSLGWTLNYEMFFYLLGAVVLMMPRPLLSLCGLLCGFATWGAVSDTLSNQISFWTNPIILEFTFGIVLAQAWRNSWVHPSVTWAVTTLIAGLLLLLIFDALQLPRFIAAGIPAALIVAAGTLFWPEMRLPNLGLGDASYALYLSHRFTLRAATLLLIPLLPQTIGGAALFSVVVALLCIAVSLFTYRLIEQPLLARHSNGSSGRVPA